MYTLTSFTDALARSQRRRCKFTDIDLGVDFLLDFLLPDTWRSGTALLVWEENLSRANAFHWKCANTPKFSLELWMFSRCCRRRGFLSFFFLSRCTAHGAQLTRWIFFLRGEPKTKRVRSRLSRCWSFCSPRTGSFWQRPPAAVHYRILCAELRFMLLCATRVLSSLWPNYLNACCIRLYWFIMPFCDAGKYMYRLDSISNTFF